MNARIVGWISSRVPDVRFLLDHVLGTEAGIDASRIGIVGHSFGGWTALSAPEVEPRFRAIVALAPGGSSLRKPGVLPLDLSFNWPRDVPTMYLVGESDISTPLSGMYELFERTPGTKQMFILRRADHLHFMDDVETLHETVRAMTFPERLAWIPREMRPVSELCSGEHAHTFVRGLALSHFDATLKGEGTAREFLARQVGAELAGRGVDAFVHTAQAV